MYKYQRILLIDDDNDDQEFFKQALSEINAELVCTVAENGIDGLKKIKIPPPPDLMFLDINMPLMDGFQYLQAVKREHDYKNIPVVMFTTSGSFNDREKAKQLGAARYIIKPNSFQNLKKVLTEVLIAGLT
ncbi:MAG: response regulator [Bacteroidia bacterium]